MSDYTQKELKEFKRIADDVRGVADQIEQGKVPAFVYAIYDNDSDSGTKIECFVDRNHLCEECFSNLVDSFGTAMFETYDDEQDADDEISLH